jgi:hypothetical protein
LENVLTGRLRRWEVDNTGSKLCPMVDFGISNVTSKFYYHSVRRGKKPVLITEVSQT